MTKRWCRQCKSHGHVKWLFLGTHFTHRLYLSHRIGKVRRKLEKTYKNE